MKRGAASVVANNARLDILLQGIRVRCIIGVYPRERRRKQPLSIDIELRYGAGRGNGSDYTDYTAVATLLRETAVHGCFATLEAFCVQAAETVFERFPAFASLRLTVYKPRALPRSARAGVRYAAERREGRETEA